MGGLIANITVYTMAMTGLIFFALLVYKKFFSGVGFTSKSGFLNVEESISLAPRKNLYVVRAGKERFLVASDADRTNLISRLDEKPQRVDRGGEELPVIVDFPVAQATQTQEKTVIKDMLKKISEL